MKMRYSICMMVFLSFIAAVCTLEAKENEVIAIPLISTPPLLDGKLDDPVWSSAARFQGLKTYSPYYGKPASEKSVMYVCSDRENFYFAARCFQKNTSQIKATVTRRDNMFGDDWITFAIDTFNNHQYAYGFVVNPLGIQGDGILNANGDLDDSYDMVWYSKGKIDDEGYTVEIKVPFKSIRFPVKKNVKMGLWLIRNIVRTSEVVSFPEIFPDKGAKLSQIQPILVRDMKYKRVIELLPALVHTQTRSHEEGQWVQEERQTEFSFTGKFGLTHSLIMDFTYNPDFSHVEADAGQVDVNLRYPLYYAEKRPFFLEGIEKFQFAGNTSEAPLYAIVHTRNIVDPIFGLKLTGKIDEKSSIDTIFAIDEPFATDEKHATFGILRFRHALKKDAFIGCFYTGRDVSEYYNRVAGIDGRLRLSQSAVAEYHLLESFTKNPNTGDSNSGHALGLRYYYDTRNVLFDIGLQDISQDFQVDTGFLTRLGLTRLFVQGMYRFYPKSRLFQRIEPYYWSYHIRDKESNLFETFNLFTCRLILPRSSVFRLDLMLANEVFAGHRFNTSGIGIQAAGQITKHFFFEIFYRNNRSIFYDPNNPYPGRTNNAFIGFLYQPSKKFSTILTLTYKDFRRKSDSKMEYDYGILRSRTTFQVNKYLFFRGIAEYNSFWDKILLDVLASFTYIPGTVVHIGYGSVLEKIRWNSDLDEYVSASQFMENRRTFFFKVSYLLRF